MANNENDEREWEEIRLKEVKLQGRRAAYKARKVVKEADLKLEQYFGLPKYRPTAEA